MRHITPIRILLFVITLFVVLYVLSLMPNGAGTTIDSDNYIAAMRSFLAGRDFLGWNGTLLIHWPPLFSASMAPVGWITTILNQDFMRVMALTNAVIFGITFFLAGGYFLDNLRNKPLALIALFSLVNFPLVHVLVYVFAEPLFNLLILLFMISMTRMMRSQNPQWLVGLAILAGLTSLQRYVGVFLVPTGALAVFLLLWSYPLRQRVIYAVVYSVPAALPTIGLLLRNYMAIGRVSADFPPPHRLLTDDLAYGAQTIVGWFSALRFDRLTVSTEVSVLLVVAVLLLVVWVIVSLRREQRLSKAALLPVCLVAGGYCCGLAALALRYDFDPPTNRFLAPIYIHVIFTVAYVIDFLLRRLKDRLRQSWALAANVAVVLLAALWVVQFPLNRAVTELYDVLSESCCMEARWFDSPLNQWLRSHPLAGSVLSNTPLPIYYSNTTAAMVPSSVSEWYNLSFLATHRYLIWMNDEHYNFNAYTLDELSSVVEITPIVELSDGGVYVVGSLRRNS